MPDRILRGGLFESEAWLMLKSNDDRCCYTSLLNIVDCFGNLPAGPYRMIIRWRPYGIDTPEKCAQVMTALLDVGLIELYTVDGKQYLHITKFRQSTRFPGHLYPLHPQATNQEKQIHTKKTRVILRESPEDSCDPPDGVGVGVGVGAKHKTVADQPVDKSKPSNPGNRLPKSKPPEARRGELPDEYRIRVLTWKAGV